MESALIIVFDLDQTLSESKVPLDGEMSSLLSELLRIKKVAVVSGASYEQFEKQFLKHLICPPEMLKNLYLLPTNGASLYEYNDNWRRVYHQELTEDEKKTIFDAFEKSLAEGGYQKPDKIYGVLIEDRSAEVTFSGLGSDAPLLLKKEWDPDFKKREKIAEILRRYLHSFSVSIGGATSIDVTKKGIDKAYGLKKVMEYLNLKPEQMLFVGDALFSGGNDASVISLGIKVVSVSDPGIGDTKRFIRKLLVNK
ncbi:MAG: HAD-IIB family hydrolase [Patescibacteria group bacterium]